MTAEERQSLVFDIVGKILGDRGRALSLTDSLTRDLKIHSDDLSFVLVPRIQQAFDIQVPVEEWAQCYTIGDVVNLLERHIAASGRS